MYYDIHHNIHHSVHHNVHHNVQVENIEIGSTLMLAHQQHSCLEMMPKTILKISLILRLAHMKRSSCI